MYIISVIFLGKAKIYSSGFSKKRKFEFRPNCKSAFSRGKKGGGGVPVGRDGNDGTVRGAPTGARIYSYQLYIKGDMVDLGHVEEAWKIVICG